MFDLDNWQEIFAAMEKNKLRTFLTAFGVFWGIFMLVMLLGAGKGLQNGIEDMFGEDAVNTLWIWNGKTSMPYNGNQPGRYIHLSESDIAKLRKIKGLNLIAPKNDLDSWENNAVKYKKKFGVFRLSATTPDYFKIDAQDSIRGRKINELDIAENRKVVTIGRRVVEVLFPKEDPLNKYIEIHGVLFKVVGTFSDEGDNGENQEYVFMPFSIYQQIFNPTKQVGAFGLTTDGKTPAKDLEEKIRKAMSTSHNFNIEDKQAMGFYNNEEQFQKFQGLFSAIRLFVWVIGSLTLIAGIVGVSNVMLIVVKERTREIGVRKALGATPFSIIGQIIQESIFITAVAGYLGLVIAVGLMELFTYAVEKANIKMAFFARPEIDLSVGISATIVLVIAGAISGLIPAIKAAKVKPIEALNAE